MAAAIAWVGSLRAPPAGAAAARTKFVAARDALLKHVTPLLAFIVGAVLAAVTYRYGGYHCVAIPVGALLLLLCELAAPLGGAPRQQQQQQQQQPAQRRGFCCGRRNDHGAARGLMVTGPPSADTPDAPAPPPVPHAEQRVGI